jgi:hypothetical protein
MSSNNSMVFAMHWLKVAVLLVLTLTAMRVTSWSFLWLLGWISKRDSVYLRLASNVLALCAFAAFLMADSVPGELLDRRALAFGVVVFAIYCGSDVKWVPSRLLRRFNGDKVQHPHHPKSDARDSRAAGH